VSERGQASCLQLLVAALAALERAFCGPR
jgi:hypothetical protein